jgi:hypothetical protein
LYALGQWREAAGYYEQAAVIAREDGREASVAGQLASAANCYTMAGDPQAGVEIAKEALEMSRAAGGSVVVAFCLVVRRG